MENFEKYTDHEVIQKVVSGDIALFEILIRRYNPYLYKTGRSYHYNHQDTEDLMQDTFVDAYVSLAKFENRSSFKTWIIRIMLNNCFKKQQKMSFKNELANEMTDKAIPMFSNQSHSEKNNVIINKELNGIIENALQQLPSDYKMVFSLREINGFNVKETAELLNISEGNVKVRLNRAKAALRSEIGKSYKAEDIFEFNLIYCDSMVNRVMEKIKSVNNNSI